MKILIVEDEPKTGDYLRQGLIEAGFVVDLARAEDGRLPRGDERVENEGEAIPPDQLERIFDRFHRASADRRRHGEDAGLGRAITRSIVLAHGGQIAAHCTDGVTLFTVRLPAASGVRSQDGPRPHLSKESAS